MKKTFVGVEKFSNEDLFSRVLASSSMYEVTKKKKKERIVQESYNFSAERERERKREKNYST